jgi:hypothetical protein
MKHNFIWIYVLYVENQKRDSAMVKLGIMYHAQK